MRNAGRRLSRRANLVFHAASVPLYWIKAPGNMNTYVKFGMLMVLIVGSLIWLAAGGISDTKTYYKTIPELESMGIAAHGQRLRVGGDVQPGSIVKKGPQVEFVLHQGAKTLNVIYAGSDPLPDTFKDNAEALADGRLGPDGVFEANKIQAKCASKYEAKPPQHRLSHDAARPSRISSATSALANSRS